MLSLFLEGRSVVWSGQDKICGGEGYVSGAVTVERGGW